MVKINTMKNQDFLSIQTSVSLGTMKGGKNEI